MSESNRPAAYNFMGVRRWLRRLSRAVSTLVEGFSSWRANEHRMDQFDSGHPPTFQAARDAG